MEDSFPSQFSGSVSLPGGNYATSLAMALHVAVGQVKSEDVSHLDDDLPQTDAQDGVSRLDHPTVHLQ